MFVYTTCIIIFLSCLELETCRSWFEFYLSLISIKFYRYIISIHTCMGESILYGNSISLKIIAGSLWNRSLWIPEVNCKLALYWISLAMQLNFHCCLQRQITKLYFIWLAKQQFVTVLTWFNRAKPGVWSITLKLMSSISFMTFFVLFAKIL